VSYIKKGANVNVLDKDKRTPLQFAVIGGHVEAATTLLEHGADPNIENIMGLNCLDLAKALSDTETPRTEVLELLKKHGATESKTPDKEYETIVVTPEARKRIQQLPEEKQNEWRKLVQNSGSKKDCNTSEFFDLFIFCKRNNIPTT